jgi:putative aldouronate transport system substrate-binding protein
MLLIAALALTACAGESEEVAETTSAASQPDTTGSTDGTDGTDGSDEEVTEKLSVEKLEKKYPGKTVLTWVYNDVVSITPEINLKINDLLVQKGCDYVLYFYSVPETLFERKVNAMINGGNTPDLICASVGAAGTYQGTYRAYQNGWLLDLEDYLQTEEGKKLWEAVPEACWQASMVDGEYLGVCTMLPVCSDAAYYVNKDLMEQYGLTEEDFMNRTPAELGELLALVQEENVCALDMDGSITDVVNVQTIVENRGYQSDAIVISNDDQDAQAENIFANDNAVAWFRAVADYRQKGYLAGTGEEEKQTVPQNFFISLGADNRFDSAYADRIIALLHSTYPEAGEIAVIPYDTMPLTTYFNSISGVCSASGHQQEALAALTMTMTDREISDLLLYGIEDEHYELDENGKINPFDIISWGYSMYFGNTLVSTPTVNEPDNKEEVFGEAFASMKETAVLGKYVDLTDYADQVEMIQEITEEYAGLWNGAFEDVDGTLAEACEKLEAAGIQEILDAVNAQLQ